MLIILLWLSFLVVIGLVLFICRNAKAAEKEKCHEAAQKIIKEEYLNRAISHEGPQAFGRQKLMICLKWKGKGKNTYVFDPETTIHIGRRPDTNEICIRDNTVSERHCKLTEYQGQVVLTDYNSKNGTWVKRGLRTHAVRGAEYVFSGDKITVGDLCMKLGVFFVDTSFL